MNDITKKYYGVLDDLCYWLRTGTIQITSGVTEYDDENLEMVFDENAKLKMKLLGKDEEIERLNNIIDTLEDNLEREINIKEEDLHIEHNTYIDKKETLEKVLKHLRELKEKE